jgi:hypothetical protein
MKGQSCILLLALAFFFGLGAPVALLAEDTAPLAQQAPAVSNLLPGPAGSASPSVSPASQTFHDIRGPVALSETGEMLSWILIGLAVVALAAVALFLWRHRRKRASPPPLPHERALTELALLRPMMIPEQALQYAAELAEILRRYMEARFHLPSTRQTTREFFAGSISLSQAVGRMERGHHDRLRACLEQCDLAKFAHCAPGVADMESMEQAVRAWIESTGQSGNQEGGG